MKLEVKYSGKFKKGLKLAAKRGLDISLLETVVEKLANRIPLEEKYHDHPLKGKCQNIGSNNRQCDRRSNQEVYKRTVGRIKERR